VDASGRVSFADENNNRVRVLIPIANPALDGRPRH
jgi:hypothetical protein